jgi:hypothetical protein
MIDRAGHYDLDERVRLHDDRVLWREVEGEIVALALDSSQYVSVNESGGELWELLAAGTTPRQLTRALVDRWGVTEEQAQHDVDAFLHQLTRARLLET